MEEINLKDLFNYYISKIFIIIITVCVAILFSIVYGEFVKVPKYKSSSTVVLASTNDKNDNSNGITQNDITINQKLISTYREIIKSRRVLGQVIDNLDLKISVESLSSSVTVTNQQDTDVIKITVTNVKREDAALIANEIAKVFSNEIIKIYNIQNVSIIDNAIEAKAPYNIHTLKDVIIGAMLGFALGCMIIFAIYYFDTTIKNPEEVQNKLGLPILGIVPKVESGKNKRIKKISKKDEGDM